MSTNVDHPDTQPIEERLESVNIVLGAHAGGIELVDAYAGVVQLRFTGMCTGCPLRPVTTVNTVRPALADIPWINEVVIMGSRISEFAERRLAAAFAPNGPSANTTAASRERTER